MEFNASYVKVNPLARFKMTFSLAQNSFNAKYGRPLFLEVCQL